MSMIFLKHWVTKSVTPEFLSRMPAVAHKNNEGTIYCTQVLYWVGGGGGEGSSGEGSSPPPLYVTALRDSLVVKAMLSDGDLFCLIIIIETAAADSTVGIVPTNHND